MMLSKYGKMGTMGLSLSISFQTKLHSNFQLIYPFFMYCTYWLEQQLFGLTARALESLQGMLTKMLKMLGRIEIRAGEIKIIYRVSADEGWGYARELLTDYLEYYMPELSIVAVCYWYWTY